MKFVSSNEFSGDNSHGDDLGINHENLEDIEAAFDDEDAAEVVPPLPCNLLTAQIVTVSDCWPCTRLGLSGPPWLLIILGIGEDQVQHVTMCQEDGMKLMRLLHEVINGFGPPPTKHDPLVTVLPAKFPRKLEKGRRSITREAIRRVETRFASDGAAQFIDRLKRVEPHLARHFDHETGAIFEEIRRNCPSVYVADRIKMRILRSWLSMLHIACRL